jgi:hypothetical protein
VAYAYLSGKRNFFTGTGKAILDALGLEVVIRPKAVRPERPYVYKTKWIKEQD